MISATIYKNLSDLCDGRVFPMVIPEGAILPAIRYHMISRIPDYTLEGASGFSETEIQIDIVGESGDDLTAIGDVVEDRMERLP